MKTAPSIRFRIDFAENSNLGPGKIELLEAIRKQGSMSAAGRSMGMSYRRVWLLLESLNTAFTEPVSVNTVGGIGGGGVQITPFGELLIERYREIEKRFNEMSSEYLTDIRTRIKINGPLVSKRVPVSKKPKRRTGARKK